MPLLKVTPPPNHSSCSATEHCAECAAKRNLTREDWDVVDFFSKVQDQTINLTPMGTEDGTYILAPRLEGWLAACDIYEIPQDDRAEIIDCARALFEAIHGRVRLYDVMTLPLSELAVPELRLVSAD